MLIVHVTVACEHVITYKLSSDFIAFKITKIFTVI
jgi:hypothetical protein